MISRAHRFHGRASLRYVYQHGQSVRGPLFAVRSSLNTKRDSYRLAVVVSRKVHKSAVARNRMRRRLYAVVRGLEADILRPYDIVLTIFSAELLDVPLEKLAGQVKRQLEQSGVLARRVQR